ncbi:MAG: hypothetical protein HKO80_03700 [Flavobacteriaceae bacterium]|nr:hypothetical protein [Flavobacteriaceae bacterium]
MQKFFRKVLQQLRSQVNFITRRKSNITILALLTSCFVFSQNRIPPPPCYANDNTGAGGVIGNGHFLHFDDEDFLNLHFYSPTDGGNFDAVLVIYMDTGGPGRTILDQTVDDSDDPYRIAITNSNAFGFGSTVTFPDGFEASYAIAIDSNSGGLYAIPSTGNIGNGDLNYITSVNSTLTSNTQSHFDISILYSDIGISPQDELLIVAMYVGHDGYTFDEGYGDGIWPGTQGADAVFFSGFRAFSSDQVGCRTTALSIDENDGNIIDATFVNNRLQINGVNDEVTINVYDLLGRNVSKITQQISGYAKIPIELLKDQLQFIVVESSNKKKVIKVIPH